MEGIDQILKVQNAVVEAGNVADKIVHEQGGVTAKVAHVADLFDELLGLAGVDFSKVRSQLADLNGEEKAQLLARFKEKFDIADDHAEGKIESGLALAVKAEELVREVIAFAKSVNPVPAAPAPGA
jgi:hypothetical protein